MRNLTVLFSFNIIFLQKPKETLRTSTRFFQCEKYIMSVTSAVGYGHERWPIGR